MKFRTLMSFHLIDAFESTLSVKEGRCPPSLGTLLNGLQVSVQVSVPRSTRDVLNAYYAKHSPEMLPHVDDVLKKFSGRHATLLQALSTKYGDPPSPFRHRLVALFRRYCPGREADVDMLLERFEGCEQDLIDSVVTMYGPEPSSTSLGSAPLQFRQTVRPSHRDVCPSQEFLYAIDRAIDGVLRSELAALQLVYTMGIYSENRITWMRVLVEASYLDVAPMCVYDARFDDTKIISTNKKIEIKSTYNPFWSPPPDNRARLTRYFEKYNPEKVKDVDGFLEQYAGKEATLFTALVAKYGPEPTRGETEGKAHRSVVAAPSPPSNQFRARLVRFFEKYNSVKVTDVEVMLNAYRGDEEELFAQCVAKYGPEPPEVAPSSNVHRARLTRYFEKYNPEKVKDVDGFLEDYAGKESTLFTALVEKYGPEPTRGATEANQSVVTTTVDNRARLTRYFEKYNPEKVKDVDGLLEQYAGDETTLFDKLVAKYGPEPTTEVSRSVVATTVDNRARLTRYFEKYNPEKVKDVDGLLEQYAGDETTLFDKLVAKYGPEPRLLDVDLHRRLLIYYYYYCPDNVPQAATVLQAYGGREESLFEDLVGRYGAEPTRAELQERIRRMQGRDNDWFTSRITSPHPFV